MYRLQYHLSSRSDHRSSERRGPTGAEEPNSFKDRPGFGGWLWLLRHLRVYNSVLGPYLHPRRRPVRRDETFEQGGYAKYAAERAGWERCGNQVSWWQKCRTFEFLWERWTGGRSGVADEVSGSSSPGASISQLAAAAAAATAAACPGAEDEAAEWRSSSV